MYSADASQGCGQYRLKMVCMQPVVHLEGGGGGKRPSKPHTWTVSYLIIIIIYTNKAKRNLFACFRMAGHALHGMAPCFGHTGVTFDAENGRPGPGSLQGHFEAVQGRFLKPKALF